MVTFVVPGAPFFHIAQELLAFEDFTRAMEEHLPLIAENEKNIIYAEFDETDDQKTRDGMEAWAAEFFDETLFRMYRSQILVTLWAIYESGIDQIGKHVREKGGHELKARDLHRKDTFTKYKLYFQNVLGIPLVITPQAEEYLTLLLKVRNAIVHGNGRRDGTSADWNVFKSWEAKGLSTELDRLSFSYTFVAEMVEVVSRSLRDLIERAQRAVKG
jgi:hypothetical protein